MMNNTQLSKFLSFVLRHKPESIGLTLDAQGWADIDTLVLLSAVGKAACTKEQIFEVVKSCEKQRFTLSGDKTQIRAAQGHSTSAVNMSMDAKCPPKFLYHGSATRFEKSILANGLKPMRRHHVHLSADIATAVTVGSRHGKPVVFTVDAKEMHDRGYKFYLSDNDVWLTNEVPATFFVK